MTQPKTELIPISDIIIIPEFNGDNRLVGFSVVAEENEKTVLVTHEVYPHFSYNAGMYEIVDGYVVLNENIPIALPDPMKEPLDPIVELAQHITDLEIADLEKGQQITDLELQIIEMGAKING